MNFDTEQFDESDRKVLSAFRAIAAKKFAWIPEMLELQTESANQVTKIKNKKMN